MLPKRKFPSLKEKFLKESKMKKLSYKEKFAKLGEKPVNKVKLIEVEMNPKVVKKLKGKIK